MKKSFSILFFSVFLTVLIADSAVLAGSPDVAAIPVITCTDFSGPFEPAYLSNGMIGVRPDKNALQAAKPSYVSGYVKDWQWEKSECIADAPYPFGVDIKINGESIPGDQIQPISQTLDMSCGELVTVMKYTKGDLVCDLKVLQFLPRTLPSAACQNLEISVNQAAELSCGPLTPQGTIKAGDNKARNELGLVLMDAQAKTYTLKAGEKVQYQLVAAMVSQFYHPEPELQARRVAGWAKMLGFDKLRNANKQAWQELWKGRIKIYGSPEDQKAMDAAFFYTHASCSRFCLTGIGPYVYSNEAFCGHGFWDMDHWVFQAILPVNPQAARSMMEYRFRGLEMSKRKAATFGFNGAMYSWESSQIDGSEMTSTSANTGWAEHHVIPGVALAFWEYYLATGDRDFLEYRAWPVMKECAAWIEGRGQFTERGFEITDVLGFDEQTPSVDNNAHMNLLCRMAMKATCQTAEKLGLDTPKAWKKIVDAIYLPIDKEKNVLLPYDNTVVQEKARGYSLGSAQMLVFHDPPLEWELFKQTFEYEESLRAQMEPASNCPCSAKSVGFPCPTFAASAAMMGDRKKAAELFGKSWNQYMMPPYMIMKEYPFSDAGNFVTSQGAMLQAGLFGFTGLRLNEGDWRKYEASFPAGWDKIEIDRIYIKGRPVKVIAEHGKKTQLIELD